VNEFERKSAERNGSFCFVCVWVLLLLCFFDGCCWFVEVWLGEKKKKEEEEEEEREQKPKPILI